MDKRDKLVVESRMRKLWNNYVVRNIILAGSLLIIILFVFTVLLNVFTRHNKYKDVPDFSNVTIEQARKLARKDRLRIEINDSIFVPALEPGVVLEQKPDVGTKVKPGRRIYVTINSVQQRMVDVPYVTGYSLRQAKNVLETAGLEIERIVYVNDIATNNVLEERYGRKIVKARSDVQAPLGSGIILTVGKSYSAASVSVPRVVGVSLRDAKSRLWEAGLNVGKIEIDGEIDPREMRLARIYKQEPDQGQRISLGSEVKLYVTTDADKISTGIARSDSKGVNRAARERKLTDSLRKAGYKDDQLREEVEWIMKIESGEARPEDRMRYDEEVILESLEGYGAESGN